MGVPGFRRCWAGSGGEGHRSGGSQDIAVKGGIAKGTQGGEMDVGVRVQK